MRPSVFALSLATALLTPGAAALADPPWERGHEYKARGCKYEFRTYEHESGRFCREYVTTAVIDGRVEEIRSTACREPEGGWRRMG